MRRATALAMVVVLAACSGEAGGDGPAAEPATERTTTTVDRATAEAEFIAEVNENTDGSGGEADIIAFGWSICDALDAADDVLTDDAPNDTPETDAQIAQEAAALGLDAVMAADLDDAVTGIVMRAAGGELCPDHYGTIVGYLNDRG